MEPIQTTNVQFPDALQAALYNTVQFLPKLAAFLLIAIIGYFVALAIGKVVDRVLEKVGFNPAVERSGIRRALGSTGYHPGDIVGKIVFYAIFLFVLQMAFSVFGPNAISGLLNRLIAFLPNIFVAIVIVVVAASIATGVREVVRAALGGLSYGRILASLAAGAIIVLGVFAALNQLAIAPAVVNGLFYAMLAIVVGVTVIAVGGAGIQPLRTRWESALQTLEREVPRAQTAVQTSAAVVSDPTVTPPATRPPGAEGYVI